MGAGIAGRQLWRLVHSPHATMKSKGGCRGATSSPQRCSMTDTLDTPAVHRQQGRLSTSHHNAGPQTRHRMLRHRPCLLSLGLRRTYMLSLLPALQTVWFKQLMVQLSLLAVLVCIPFALQLCCSSGKFGAKSVTVTAPPSLAITAPDTAQHSTPEHGSN